MKKPKNYMIFRKHRTQAIRSLNNVYVINSIARNSLKQSKIELESQKNAKLQYEVPIVSGEIIKVARRKSKIISLLNEAICCDLYSQSLITSVAITEDYLSKSLFTILIWYPQKLSNITIGEDRKIELSLVINSKSIEELLQKVIFNNINSVFYASPRKYFEKIENILSIILPLKIKSQFSENKATRDLLLHNSGIINSMYLAKSGNLARGTEGETIPLNSNYFDNSLRCMKKIITSSYSQLLKKYGNTSK